MLRIGLGILTVIFTFIFILFSTLVSYSGVAVPPKDLMYKHDPNYKSPDLDPEDPEVKDEKPPPIYYYKPNFFEEYYSSGKYIQSTKKEENYRNTNYYQQTNMDNTTLDFQNSPKKSNRNSLLIIFFVLILFILISISISIYNRSRQLESTPIYEKYSTKLPRKRSTIFDKVK